MSRAFVIFTFSQYVCVTYFYDLYVKKELGHIFRVERHLLVDNSMLFKN